MKLRNVSLLAAFCLLALAAFAANPMEGTWKLNEAKSNIPAGAAKNSTVTYTADGDNFKCVIDGADGSGNATHNEWTGKFDGKDYAVTGDPMSDMRSLKQVNDHHFKVSESKDGKVIGSGTVVISKDGKSRTVTVSGKDAKGKKVTSTGVYDKQ